MSKIEFPLVTLHLGAIDPESLEAYAAVGGYASLKRALTEMTSEAVLDAAPFPRSELLYARVDLVDGPDGAPLLLELELAEPSMFLPQAPPAAAAGFAAAILAI